jgi:hypothetical protein
MVIKPKYILTMLVILVVVLAIGFLRGNPKLSSNNCVNNENPLFSAYPTDIDNITQIAPPIMQVGTGVKSHSYVNVSKNSAVYAPVDSKLVTGAKYTESFLDPDQIQYTFLFEVSCEVSYYYDHLINPPEKIANLFPGPPGHDTSSEARFDSVEVKAGEVIGYSWSGQFDFGVLNNSKEPPLKDFSEYKGSEKAYADCPINYFSGEMKSALARVMNYGNMSDLRVINNLCNQN